MSRRLLPIALILTLAGCASGRIIDSWVAPDVTGPVGFRKILVVVMHPVEAVRRSGENRLVRRIGPRRAVASNTLLTMDELQDSESAKAAIDGEGLDGAIMLRVVGREQVLNYQPAMIYPAEYGQFYGFIGYVGRPTIMQGGTAVHVETNVYSITDEKLLWSGITKSLNPMDINGTIDEIADSVSEELGKQGLIARR